MALPWSEHDSKPLGVAVVPFLKPRHRASTRLQQVLPVKSR